METGVAEAIRKNSFTGVHDRRGIGETFLWWCVVFVVFLGVLRCNASEVSGWNLIQASQVRTLGDNLPAERVAPGHFRLKVDLGVLKEARAGWDFDVGMDLRNKGGIAFDFRCSDVLQCSSFIVYLKSGEGWYYAKFAPEVDGEWRRIVLRKSAFTGTEGKIVGWHDIRAMRICGSKAGVSKAEFEIANLSLVDLENPQICVVRCDSCTLVDKHRSEWANFGKFSAITARAFETTGMRVNEVSDLEIEHGDVKGARLLILPYNPELPKKALTVLAKFVDAGGKVLTCHSIDVDVRRLLGVDWKWYQTRKWRSSSETPVKVKNGFCLDHVWRYESDESFRQACGVLAQVSPEWKDTLDSAKSRIESRRRDESAWINKMPTKQKEWRAIWCHTERGLKDYGWDRSVKMLKDNGFNVLFPNLAWGGVAFYPSSVAPVHSSVAQEGDAFKACIEACRKYDVECHVWKVCWRGGNKSDKRFFERLLSEGRVQVNDKGEPQKMWMCPSHPENLRLEIETFVEIAKMRPDGIHFDYIRYPDARHCFCGGCRDRFEKGIGRKVAKWPSDVARKGAILNKEWNKFRQDNITALVKGVSNRVRTECPGVKISAAVFQGHETTPETIAQNWVDWCKKGYLDFVCPMNYYVNSDLFFEKLVRSQCKAIEGSGVKLYPGLGLSCWREPADDAITMARQIKIVRDIGLDGFVVFSFDARAENVLPVLGDGPMRPYGENRE